MSYTAIETTQTSFRFRWTYTLYGALASGLPSAIQLSPTWARSWTAESTAQGGGYGFIIITNLTPNTSYSGTLTLGPGQTVPLYFTTLQPGITVTSLSQTTTSISLALDSTPAISGKSYSITGGPSTVTGTYNGTNVNITGLSEGTSYTFTVAVTGYINGTLAKSTLSTLTATPSSIRSSSVAFTLNRVGTVALPSSYTVRDISNTVVFGTKTYSAGVLTISGLTTLTTYPFRIQATGFSDATPAAVTTVNPLTATYDNGSMTTAGATFTLTGANGIPEAVTVTNSGSPISSSIVGATVTLSGLLPGTTYSSLSIDGSGFEAALPAAITTVSAFEIVQTPVSIGATSVVLQMTPLGGTVLPTRDTSWNITYLPAQTVAASDISFNPSSKQLFIKGLSEYTEYAFTIDVAGMASQSVTVRTADVTAPGLITGLTTTANIGSVTLTWNALSDSGSSISYIVKNLNSGVEVAVSGATTTIGGLVNGTTYMFSVKAVDAVGNTGTVTNSGNVIPYSVPVQPYAAPTVTPGQNSALVAWGDVSNGGAAISMYTVRAYLATNKAAAVKTATGAASPIALTGLTANQVYVFTVSATNLRGEGPVSPFSVPKYISDKVICFLADAPVRIPGGGVRAIANIQEGDLVETADGRAVAVQHVSVMACQPGADTNPYVIPRGKWGATEDLRISPNHKVAVGNGRMVEAKNLGLKQVKMSGIITYYNLELPNWSTDRMVVAGVEVESLAPVRRKAIPVAEFNAMIARKFGVNPAPGVVDKIRRMCTFLPNGMVEYPFMKA
jgi:hypothetical protein